MYKCDDCGAVFLEPNHYFEHHGFETPPYEELWVCPFCGGAYREAVQCDVCDKVIFADEAVTDKSLNTLCPDCAKGVIALD